MERRIGSIAETMSANSEPVKFVDSIRSCVRTNLMFLNKLSLRDIRFLALGSQFLYHSTTPGFLRNRSAVVLQKPQLHLR